MEFLKKLLSEDEINQVEKILLKEIELPDDYFVNNIIDYENYYSDEESMDLIVDFLNNFSTEVDDEIEFHEQFPRYNLLVSLIKPISEKKFLDFKIKKKNDNFKFYVIFNDKVLEINSILFNTIMAYLVSHGLVYDFELESIIKNKQN